MCSTGINDSHINYKLVYLYRGIHAYIYVSILIVFYRDAYACSLKYVLLKRPKFPNSNYISAH